MTDDRPADDRPAPRRRRWIRFAVLMALATVGWFALNRALSPWAALRIVRPEGAEAPVQGAERRGLLRVGIYNIAHGRGSGDSNWNGESRDVRERRLNDIAGFLKAADLDVVVLNEVDFDSTWSGRVNQAEFLARAAGFDYRVEQRNFDVSVPFFRWRFGNAVLSRRLIVSAEMLDLPGDAAWETILAGKKTACVCTIDLGDGRSDSRVTARVAPVHLSYRSEAVRIASASVFLNEVKRGESPLILAGDFNSTPADFPEADPSGQSAVEELLQSGIWSTLPREHAFEPDMTFSSTRPDRVIDWILVPQPWELLTKQVFPVTFSDHRPVIGVIRY